MGQTIDREYIDRLTFKLEGFKWERDGLANFRCPLCGDSKTNQNKRRGYFYLDRENDCYRFKCHNCGEMSGWSLGPWLSKYDESLFREYQLANFRVGNKSNHKNEMEILGSAMKPSKLTHTNRITQPSKPKAKLPESLLCHSVRIIDLPDDHYAKQYVMGRKLPEWALELLCFSEDYRKLVEALGITEEELLWKCPEDSRIIIPLLAADGSLMGIQGRALNPEATLRYATMKLKEEYPKFFGLERWNKMKPSLVVEGPLDSLFLPNCVATTDSNLLKFKEGTIYIPDNQYRNKEICRGIENIIESGKKICLFPPSIEHKDINDMVLKGGLSPRQVVELIVANVYQGMKAKLRWSQLKKV